MSSDVNNVINNDQMEKLIVKLKDIAFTDYDDSAKKDTTDAQLLNTSNLKTPIKPKRKLPQNDYYFIEKKKSIQNIDGKEHDENIKQIEKYINEVSSSEHFKNMNEKLKNITPQKVATLKEFGYNLSNELIQVFLRLRLCHKDLGEDDVISILQEVNATYQDENQENKENIVRHLNDYLDDCKKNLKIRNKQNKNDDDYVQYIRNTTLGKLVENMYASNHSCPICEKQLYQYKNPFFPVFDFVCSNYFEKEKHQQHNQHSHFFQMKCKFNVEHSSYYFTHKYFTPSDSQYRDFFHNILPKDTKTKEFAINYICLSYNNVGHNVYNFDGENSYMLFPCLKTETNEPFYSINGDHTYLKKSTFKWNQSNVNHFTLTKENIDSITSLEQNVDNANKSIFSSLTENNNIDNTSVFGKIDFNKEIAKQINFGGSKYKSLYLKYKTKYLRLKNKLAKSND